MQALKTGLAGIVVLVSWMVVLNPQPAFADHCGAGQAEQEVEGALGHICITVTDTDTGGGGSLGGDDDGGGGPPKCYDGGHEVACENEMGVWFSNPGCYAQPADPQPGPNDPAWKGHDPSEGSIYACMRTADGLVLQVVSLFFVANGQAPLPDPRVLAERALDQLDLAVPEINIAPDPPLATYVGLDTWLWLPEEQWDSLSLTVTAGPTSVTVTATPARVDWDLTEGITSCPSAGRPWARGMSSNAKTDCSYTFSTLSDGQPDDRYAVSATIAYSATWTCSGACTSNSGDLGEVPSVTSNDAIEVDERQSVVIH